MSLFICTPKHFNSIEQKTMELVRDQKIDFDYNISEMFTKLRLDNIHAYCIRYGEDFNDYKAVFFANKKWECIHLSDISYYRALACLKYQLESFDDPDWTTPEEIILLDKLIEKVGEMILFGMEIPEGQPRWSI